VCAISARFRGRYGPEKSFVDCRTVTAHGGNGGDGCIHFLRLWRNDKAGPSGGDGGHGGHVIFRVSYRDHADYGSEN
jgi:GTP-binding protein